MKMFVRNDNRLYNITKRQCTFLCINDRLQKSYKSLQKSYKSYKVVISISLWALDRCLPDRCRCMSSVALRVSIYV